MKSKIAKTLLIVSALGILSSCTPQSTSSQVPSTSQTVNTTHPTTAQPTSSFEPSTSPTSSFSETVDSTTSSPVTSSSDTSSSDSTSSYSWWLPLPPTGGATELTSVSFSITLAQALDPAYSLFALTEDNGYQLPSAIALTPESNTVFKGTYSKEGGISFDGGEADKFEFKLVLGLAGDKTPYNVDYESNVFAIDVDNTTSALDATVDNVEIQRPSMTSYFIASITDSDNNGEDVTAASKRYLHYVDKDGNDKSPSAFDLGETVYVRYESPLLMDGRTIIDHATVGVNAATSTELTFEQVNDDVTAPVWQASFVKTEKDARLKIALGYEYQLGVDEASAPYIAKLTIDGKEASVNDLVASPKYYRYKTPFEVTLAELGNHSANVVGYKIKSSDSYAFDSGSLDSGDTYEGTLSKNDQKIQVNVGDFVRKNLNLDTSFRGNVDWTWNKSEWTSPDNMFDGADGKDNGFDNWSDEFKANAPISFTVHYNSPARFPVREFELEWYVASDDATLPDTIAVTYQSGGTADWKTLDVTTADNITTGYFGTEADGINDLSAIKVEFLGPVGTFAKIAEFRLWSIGK